jgi:hypothetical protein
MEAIKATVHVTYEGRNITTDLQPFLLGFSYTDRIAGESDELEILLMDSDGRWRGDWFPTKRDRIKARIEAPSGILECGTFEIDEVEASGSREGDGFIMRALAAGHRQTLRTRRSSALEGTSLKGLAQSIAARHGLTLQGTIADIPIARAVQYRQTDLEYLAALAAQYGYLFSVRGTLMVFTSVYELEDKDAALEVKRAETLGWSIKDKTSGVFKKARHRKHHPKKRKVIEVAAELQADTNPTDDHLEWHGEAEDSGQAEHKAKAHIHKAARAMTEGGLSMRGNIYAVSGANVHLPDYGQLSGTYRISESTHSVSREMSYTTDITVQRIRK